MKKLKLNFGEGGFQGWMIRHVEKFVLVLFVIFMVWFVVNGSSLEGMKGGQTPDRLKSDSEQAISHVRADRWDVVAKDPARKVELNVKQRVEKDIEAVTMYDKYPLPVPWNQRLFQQLEPRLDPKIYAPERLIVVPITGHLAYFWQDGDVDPLEPLAPEEGEEKPKPKPKSKDKGKGAFPPGAGGMPGMGMPGMGMPGGPAGGKRKGGAGGGGMLPPGAGDEGVPGAGNMPGMGELDGMPGGGMPGGGMPGGGVPGMQSQSGASDRVIGYVPPGQATLKTHYANVVMAVVPYEKQVEEFDRALKNSLDHDPVRDRPNYLTFKIERVDVTANPDVDPATITDEDWAKERISSNADLIAARDWAGFPAEIVDVSYLAPVLPTQPGQPLMPGLTHPLPPFVQRDLWDAMTHPDIPLAAAATAIPSGPTKGRTRKPAGEETETGDEIPGGIPAGRGSGFPGIPGMPGGGGMLPPGAGIPDGAGMLPPGAEGGEEGAPGAGMGAGMPGMGGPGMGGMGGPGMGMPGMGGAVGNFVARVVKYKLIRYTDLAIEPGHKYRYRVRVVLEDPNYPTLAASAPSMSGLHPDVRKRITAVEAADLARGDKKRTYYITSEPSAPSDVVSSPPTEWFYAGKVHPDIGQTLDAKLGLKYYSKEPSATALGVVQDATLAVDVPAQLTVYRGSTLNFVRDKEKDEKNKDKGIELQVVHPLYHDMRPLEKYVFRTDAVVADMRGGEKIPLVLQEKENNLSSPGELLFVDAEGNMHVGNEAEDIDFFHRFVEVEQEETKKEEEAGDGFMPGFPGMGVPGGAGGIPGAPPGFGGPPGKGKK